VLIDRPREFRLRLPLARNLTQATTRLRVRLIASVCSEIEPEEVQMEVDALK
jgi:hypothetical protein